eukprot:804385_1
MPQSTLNHHKTVGEELWLVHLKRQKYEDDDTYDRIPRKRRNHKSVGEELYEIHLKRSQGFDQQEGDNLPLRKDSSSSGQGKDCPASKSGHHDDKTNNDQNTINGKW